MMQAGALLKKKAAASKDDTKLWFIIIIVTVALIAGLVMLVLSRAKIDKPDISYDSKPAVKNFEAYLSDRDKTSLITVPITTVSGVSFSLPIEKYARAKTAGEILYEMDKAREAGVTYEQPPLIASTREHFALLDVRDGESYSVVRFDPEILRLDGEDMTAAEVRAILRELLETGEAGQPSYQVGAVFKFPDKVIFELTATTDITPSVLDPDKSAEAKYITTNGYGVFLKGASGSYFASFLTEAVDTSMMLLCARSVAVQT